jgi:hypothetical protein
MHLWQHTSHKKERNENFENVFKKLNLLLNNESISPFGNFLPKKTLWMFIQ